MKREDLNERLSKISTMWTVLHQAQAGAGGTDAFTAYKRVEAMPTRMPLAKTKTRYRMAVSRVRGM